MDATAGPRCKAKNARISALSPICEVQAGGYSVSIVSIGRCRLFQPVENAVGPVDPSFNWSPSTKPIQHEETLIPLKGAICLLFAPIFGQSRS
jgi:hypothetical protein